MASCRQPRLLAALRAPDRAPAPCRTRRALRAAAQVLQRAAEHVVERRGRAAGRECASDPFHRGAVLVQLVAQVPEQRDCLLVRRLAAQDCLASRLRLGELAGCAQRAGGFEGPRRRHRAGPGCRRQPLAPHRQIASSSSRTNPRSSISGDARRRSRMRRTQPGKARQVGGQPRGDPDVFLHVARDQLAQPDRLRAGSRPRAPHGDRRAASRRARPSRAPRRWSSCRCTGSCRARCRPADRAARWLSGDAIPSPAAPGATDRCRAREALAQTLRATVGRPSGFALSSRRDARNRAKDFRRGIEERIRELLEIVEAAEGELPRIAPRAAGATGIGRSGPGR